jgi:hypothetical protein
MLGGFLGGGKGPVSDFGATLGGAGGEAFNQLIQHADPGGVEGPQTSADAARRIGTAGATGAVSNLTGRGLSNLAGAGGAFLKAKGYRFPTQEILATMDKFKLRPGRIGLGKKGSERAAELVAKATLHEKDELMHAGLRGATMTIRDILHPLQTKIAAISRQPAMRDEALKMMRYVEEEAAKYTSGQAFQTTAAAAAKAAADKAAALAVPATTRSAAPVVQQSLEGVGELGRNMLRQHALKDAPKIAATEARLAAVAARNSSKAALLTARAEAKAASEAARAAGSRPSLGPLGGEHAKRLMPFQVDELIKSASDRILAEGGASGAKKTFLKLLSETAEEQLGAIPKWGPRYAQKLSERRALEAAHTALVNAETRGGAHAARLLIPLGYAGAGAAGAAFTGGGNVGQRLTRAAGGAAVGAAASSPAIQTRAGLALAHPLLQQLLLRQPTNLLGGAVRDAFAQP